MEAAEVGTARAGALRMAFGRGGQCWGLAKGAF